MRQADKLDESRIVFYKRQKQLGAKQYLVEISTSTQDMYIAAWDTDSPESFLIELPEKRGQEILHQFEGDYERVASSLQMMNKRLVLLNPKFI